MTTDQITAKLTALEQRLTQAREQARTADAIVHQLLGACAVLRELLAGASAEPAAPAPSENGDQPEPAPPD
jgi:hypothetical protein